MNLREISSGEYRPRGAHRIFWNYYRSLQQDAAAQLPQRTDFDPLKVAHILPKLAVSEFIDENTQMVRLVGGGHEALWERNIVGKNYFDFIEPSLAARRKVAYREIVERPCGCLVEDEAVDVDGNNLQSSGLILPTLNGAGAPTLFISCYDFISTDGSIDGLAHTAQIDHDVSSTTFISLEK